MTNCSRFPDSVLTGADPESHLERHNVSLASNTQNARCPSKRRSSPAPRGSPSSCPHTSSFSQLQTAPGSKALSRQVPLSTPVAVCRYLLPQHRRRCPLGLRLRFCLPPHHDTQKAVLKRTAEGHCSVPCAKQSLLPKNADL